MIREESFQILHILYTSFLTNRKIKYIVKIYFGRNPFISEKKLKVL